MHIWPMAEGKRGARTPPQSEVEQIAGRLRISRMALSLTPAALCRLTKIRPNTYSQWESAKGRPRIDEARLLKKYLGYTLDWIYEGDRGGLSMDLAAKIAALEAPASPPAAKARKAAA